MKFGTAAFSLSAVAVALVISSAANAGTISDISGDTLTTSLANGPSGNVNLQTFVLNNAGVVSGSSGNNAAPFDYSTGVQTTAPYIAIYGGGNATLNLSSAANAFGFSWGSVDTYNTVTFLNGNTTVASFTGTDAVNASGNLVGFTTVPGNGQGGNWNYGGTVYTQIDTTQAFNEVVLSSGSNSFEFGNASVSAVPIPGALPLFGTALVGVSVLARRRAKKTA